MDGGGHRRDHRSDQLAEPFLIFWLGGWAVGWICAVSALAAQLGDAEIVRVIGGDLEGSGGVGRLRRTWHYRGREIENLTNCEPDIGAGGRQTLVSPFLRMRGGAVKFDYGAESVFLAAGVDEPEGRVIVRWLIKRLGPAGVGWANKTVLPG